VHRHVRPPADRLVCQWKLLLAESAAHSPDKLTILAEREVLSQTDAWPHVALADGYLLCKDRAGTLVCQSLTR
jgi:hypothetical protein